MPKRRANALYKTSPDGQFKKSRDEADDVVIEVVRNAAQVTDDSSGDERLQQLSSADEMSPNARRGAELGGVGGHNNFSSSLDAALRRAAVLERRAAREEREEEAIRAAAAVLKADEDADAVAAEEEAEAEAMAVAQAHEAARAARVGGGGRRRLSELDVAEMMADGRLAEPQRMRMMSEHEQDEHTLIERGLDGHRVHGGHGGHGGHVGHSQHQQRRHHHQEQLSSRRSSMEFAPPMDTLPCPIYDVDVQLRKYVRTDGRQLSHTPVAMAARQNRQKRKEYVKKMEIAYANMQFETQYLRERMSRLQQELKWYKDRWAEHATKCPLLHVGGARRLQQQVQPAQPSAAFKSSGAALTGGGAGGGAAGAPGAVVVVGGAGGGVGGSIIVGGGNDSLSGHQTSSVK